MRNKERHGCLTAWLIYLMIAYSIGSLSLFFGSESMYKRLPYLTSENTMLIVASIGIFNAMFSFFLLKWVKLGFWGLLSTNVVLLIIQINESDNLIYPIVTIIYLLILYVLLKLKKNYVSGWDNLD
jgi:uncharacterized membrane protein